MVYQFPHRLFLVLLWPLNPRNEHTQEGEDDDASQRNIETPDYNFSAQRSICYREWFCDRSRGPGSSAAEAHWDQAGLQRSRSFQKIRSTSTGGKTYSRPGADPNDPGTHRSIQGAEDRRDER